jgi:transglutaminase-like putative cysteine protease
MSSGHGVCRDFAHLAVAICRALTIPTRYAFGYLPDIDVPPPPDPMDFCAWMEVYLDGAWWAFDPRNNARRIGRTVIGRGRDAADVAMISSWGPAQLRGMTVVTEPVS